MTDIAALVERLRKAAEDDAWYFAQARGNGPQEPFTEAADALEALQTERDEYFLQWQNLRLKGSPDARNVALEEAAKVAGDFAQHKRDTPDDRNVHELTAIDIAAAIRALKDDLNERNPT